MRVRWSRLCLRRRAAVVRPKGEGRTSIGVLSSQSFWGSRRRRRRFCINADPSPPMKIAEICRTSLRIFAQGSSIVSRNVALAVMRTIATTASTVYAHQTHRRELPHRIQEDYWIEGPNQRANPTQRRCGPSLPLKTSRLLKLALCGRTKSSDNHSARAMTLG